MTRKKRSSRRLHGLAGTPAEHAQEAKTYYKEFKSAEKELLSAIRRKDCSHGLAQLEQMAEFRGHVIANVQNATASAALYKMHDHVTSDERNLTGKFFTACVNKTGTGFSGLGRTRRSRRSRR